MSRDHGCYAPPKAPAPNHRNVQENKEKQSNRRKEVDRTCALVAAKNGYERREEIADWQTFPQLYVNGELLGGADIVEEMFEAGELAEALGVEQPEAVAAPAAAPPAQSPPLQIE